MHKSESTRMSTSFPPPSQVVFFSMEQTTVGNFPKGRIPQESGKQTPGARRKSHGVPHPHAVQRLTGSSHVGHCPPGHSLDLSWCVGETQEDKIVVHFFAGHSARSGTMMEPGVKTRSLQALGQQLYCFWFPTTLQ